MQNFFLNRSLDCISFNGLRLRYLVQEKTFSCVGGIIFWIDYSAPLVFDVKKTIIANEHEQNRMDKYSIQFTQIEKIINSLADTDILMVLSDYKVLNMKEFTDGEPENAIQAVLFEIGNSMDELVTKILLHLEVDSNSDTLYLSFDNDYIENLLSCKRIQTNEFIFISKI